MIVNTNHIDFLTALKEEAMERKTRGPFKKYDLSELENCDCKYDRHICYVKTYDSQNKKDETLYFFFSNDVVISSKDVVEYDGERFSTFHIYFRMLENRGIAVEKVYAKGDLPKIGFHFKKKDIEEHDWHFFKNPSETYGIYKDE